MKLFSDFIREYQGGKLDEILGAKLSEVVERVEQMRKKGSLNLAIELKPDTAGMMAVTTNYVSKLPTHSTLTGSMFIKDNELKASDPNQKTLELVSPAPTKNQNVKAI